MKFPKIFLFVFLVIVPLHLSFYFIYNSKFSDKSNLSFEEQVKVYKTNKDVPAEINFYIDHLKSSDEIKYHYYFIDCFNKLNSQDVKSNAEKTWNHFKSTPKNYYLTLCRSQNIKIRDLGLIISAKILGDSYLGDKSSEALIYLDSVENQNELYYYLVRGEILASKRGDQAEAFFKIAIDQHNSVLAANFLFNYYYERNENVKAYEILNRYKFEDITSPIYKRLDIAKANSFFALIKESYRPFYSQILKLESIIAFVICFLWIVFIFYLDVFREIKILTVINLILGVLILFPTIFIIYDFFTSYLITENSSKLFYYIFVVGLIEELFKAMPVAIIYFISKKKQSAFELFTLFAISSLLFACLENILYFNNYYSVTVSSTRSIITVSLHLFLTGFFSYGFIVRKFKKSNLSYVFLFPAIAIVSHGLIDFFLDTGYYILVLAMLLVGAFSWSSMVNNCINNSPKYNDQIKFNSVKASFMLLLGFSILILVEFGANSYLSGFTFASIDYVNDLSSLCILTFILAISLTRFDFVKSNWSFIDFHGARKLFSFSSNTVKEIIVSPIHSFSDATESPIKLEIIDRRINTDQESVYLVKTADENYFYLSFKDENDTFYDFNVIIYLREANDYDNKSVIDIKKIKIKGMYKMSPVSY